MMPVSMMIQDSLLCHYCMRETPTSKSLLHVIITSVLYDFLTKLSAVQAMMQMYEDGTDPVSSLNLSHGQEKEDA